MTTFATITLDDRSGYARSNEPVVVSIPLAEADNLTSFSSLAIRQSGTIIPAQFQVLSRWGDVTNTSNPIRILQAIFRVASLSANSRDSTTYTLTDGGSGTASGGITVDTSNANYIEITTGSTAGAGRFRIRTTAGGGHNVLESGEVHTGSAFKTVIATGNSSSLYLHGVATAADVYTTTNTQNADYNSRQHTTTSTNALYSVAVESSGPERVVILVIGKFGNTPFQGMNDEGGRAENITRRTPADFSYEMRYTFWRDSAYVGMDWLIKAPEGQDDIHDGAIDHGGIQIDQNTVGGSGPNIDVFVSVHNNAGTQQGEVLAWNGTTVNIPRVFQVAAPSGAGYAWSLDKQDFTLAGATQLRESFMVVQRNATGTPPTNDRHLVLMHRGTLNNRPVVAPHGFWYDGTIGCISLWPTQSNELATQYTSTRPYHIFPSQMFYNWQGGLLLGDGLYSSTTVRSQWKRFCNSPIVPWCGPKYQTSKAWWYLMPDTLTRTGEADWNEAVTRRRKWGTCLVTSADSSDGRTIQSSYDDRNNANFSFYWWFAYGAWCQGEYCMSNHYDFVQRVLHTWMVTGLPELWEWADRCAQHMAFVCTCHGGQTYPSEHGNIMNSWTQYQALILKEGFLHAMKTNFGLGLEVNTNMYKALMYMATGYQPYKDAAQVLITTKRGFMYNSMEKAPIGSGNFDLANPAHQRDDGLTRRFSWGVEEFLAAFLMQGDTTSLQYARNLAVNVLAYTDRTAVGLELLPTSTTIGSQGGTGAGLSHTMGALNAHNDIMCESTYTAYMHKCMVLAHDIGTWSLAHGYSVFSTGDLALLRTFIQQATKYLLIGLNKTSRNNGSTAALRGSLAPPVMRGHNKTGGTVTSYASPYEWRWGATDQGANTRSTDTGLGAIYTGTCTISGTAVTVFNPPPTCNLAGAFFYANSDTASAAVRISAQAIPQFSGSCTLTASSTSVTNLVAGGGYSLTPSLAGGWLFVTSPYEITKVVRIATHTSGSTSATLASAYDATTSGSVSIYILSATATLASAYAGAANGNSNVNVTIMSGLGTHDIPAQSLNLFAYAAKLFGDDGDSATQTYLLQATRDLFENIYLYATQEPLKNLDEPFAVGTRGLLRVGSDAFHNERIHGWHTRSADYYLAYEAQLAEVSPLAILVRN